MNIFEAHGIKEHKGLNKYSLLESSDSKIQQIYEDVFYTLEGSLTTVSDNDAVSKFNVAKASLSYSETQLNILSSFQDVFQQIETQIDPEKLNFFITQAMDGELCINRTSEQGISKIIINEDGVVAYSFIPYKGVDLKDVLEFIPSEKDFEKYSYCFFIL